jgi:hypothetical protein
MEKSVDINAIWFRYNFKSKILTWDDTDKWRPELKKILGIVAELAENDVKKDFGYPFFVWIFTI